MTKHVCKFYPTGETEFMQPWDYAEVGEEYKGISYYATLAKIPKMHKWMCECGKVKWVKEK